MQARSLSGLWIAQMFLISPPATSNAITTSMAPSSSPTRPGRPLTVRSWIPIRP